MNPQSRLLHEALVATVQALNHLDSLESLSKRELAEVWSFCDGTDCTPNAKLVLTITRQDKDEALEHLLRQEHERGYREGMMKAMMQYRKQIRNADHRACVALGFEDEYEEEE